MSLIRAKFTIEEIPFGISLISQPNAGACMAMTNELLPENRLLLGTEPIIEIFSLLVLLKTNKELKILQYQVYILQ